MAINPLSDIVLDVTRAVDSQVYHASVEKLQKVQTNAEVTSFNEVHAALTLEGMRPPARRQDMAIQTNPHRQFEAFMLQRFITDMFTSDTSSVFGKGAGADFWKGLLAEKMADEMAQSGGIGVAALLENQEKVHTQQKSSSFDHAIASTIVNQNQINLVRSVIRGKE